MSENMLPSAPARLLLEAVQSHAEAEARPGESVPRFEFVRELVYRGETLVQLVDATPEASYSDWSAVLDGELCAYDELMELIEFVDCVLDARERKASAAGEGE